MVDVSIILVSFNTRQLLADCIDSIIAKSRNFKYEIIVVDNNSSDGSSIMIRDSYPTIKLIENEANLGFGAANNIGFEVSRGEFCLFLNTDTVVLDNAIFCLWEFMKSKIEVGASGGALLNADLTPQISFGRFPTVYSIVFEFTLKSKFQSYYNDNLSMEGVISGDNIVDVDYITGADLLVRREVMNLVGGFDEDFFLYFEESEFCYRIRELGFRVIILPQARIIHLCGQSTRRAPSLQQVLWFEDSRIKFFRKTKGYVYAFFAYAVLLILYTIGAIIKKNHEYWQNRLRGLLKTRPW